MKDFKYNIIELIESIRDRPCLWDKTIESYKDRIERRAAWEEIFNILDKNYENQSREEKRVTGEYILSKWANIRDSFVRSLKSRRGNKQRKRYLYYRHLKFLIPHVIPNDELSEYEDGTDQGSFNEKDDDDDDDAHEESTSSNYKVRQRSRISHSDEDDYPTYEVAKKSKKSRNFVVNESKTAEVTFKSCSPDFVGVDESDPRVMNEDEAFFASLLPTVVKYDEDDRLEFRIEVLKLMKMIKEKRNRPGKSCD